MFVVPMRRAADSGFNTLSVLRNGDLGPRNFKCRQRDAVSRPFFFPGFVRTHLKCPAWNPHPIYPAIDAEVRIHRNAGTTRYRDKTLEWFEAFRRKGHPAVAARHRQLDAGSFARQGDIHRVSARTCDLPLGAGWTAGQLYLTEAVFQFD
jgi:hypothetical protein